MSLSFEKRVPSPETIKKLYPLSEKASVKCLLGNQISLL